MPQIPISDGTYLAGKWIEYMHSAEHEREKARSREFNEEDEEAVNQKKREGELTMQVHSLRHQLRHMKCKKEYKNIHKNSRHWKRSCKN